MHIYANTYASVGCTMLEFYVAAAPAAPVQLQPKPAISRAIVTALARAVHGPVGYFWRSEKRGGLLRGSIHMAMGQY